MRFWFKGGSGKSIFRNDEVYNILGVEFILIGCKPFGNLPGTLLRNTSLKPSISAGQITLYASFVVT